MKDHFSITTVSAEAPRLNNDSTTSFVNISGTAYIDPSSHKHTILIIIHSSQSLISDSSWGGDGARMAVGWLNNSRRSLRAHKRKLRIWFMRTQSTTYGSGRPIQHVL